MTLEQHQKGIELVGEINNLNDLINNALPIKLELNLGGYYYRVDNDPQVKALLSEARQYIEEAIKMYLQSRHDSLSAELEKI